MVNNSTRYCLMALVCILLIRVQTVSGIVPSSEGDTLSYTEMIHRINSADPAKLRTESGSSYVFKNCTFKLNSEEGDSVFFADTMMIFGGDTAVLRNFMMKNVEILNSVTFRNCSFIRLPDFVNVNFNGVIEFINCKISSVKFEKCFLGKGVRFINCELDEIVLEKNELFQGIRIKDSEIERVIISGNYFKDYSADSVNWEIDRYFDLVEVDSYVRIQRSIIKRTTIEGNEFSPLSNAKDWGWPFETISLVSCEFEYLGLFDQEVRSVNIDKSIISDFLGMSGMIIVERFVWDKPHYPEDKTNISWEQLGGQKIGFYDDNRKLYRAVDSLQLANEYSFNELLSTYNKLYHMYKNRGDIASANGCYVEMKDIQSERLEYLYNVDRSLPNYFNWKLNVFLKVFCDYGTSPVKSLIISLYVVLCFACFYFFFYSEWDRINRTFLMRKYNKLLTYFRSEQKLEDFYTEEHKEEFRSYAQFKDNLQESKIEVPLFINLLGKPLYHLSLVQHNVKQWLYRRSEILSGKWIDLSKGRRIYVSVITGISVLFYIGYLISIRSINSLFLSINTFSTLGFGDIPVKGISRYMAILEGFLGWFLLSIFSVSLISQILQN